MKPTRAVLHVARLADAVLFWPILAIVLWGQLRPDVPDPIPGINDKLLHFTAYFVLAAMASGALKEPRMVKWAVVALIVLGAAVEILQAYVGHETSLLDGVANGAGATAGAMFARFVLDHLRARLPDG